MKTEIIESSTPELTIEDIKSGETFFPLGSPSISDSSVCMKIEKHLSWPGTMYYVILATGEVRYNDGTRQVHRAIQTSPGVFKREK